MHPIEPAINQPMWLTRTISRSPLFWLLALLVITALAYLPGLAGPFLFDDAPNIVAPIGDWLAGRSGWQEIVLGNRSGLLGRSLSMLSFLGNAAVSGLDPLPFKLTNLAIHLCCGILLYALLSRLLPRDRLLSSHTRLAAFAVTALWLLHPMQVSTVLYVVQRMAQLSAVFVLAALLAYVSGRLALESGQKRAGLMWLFLAVPLATLAAALSKENGILVPLMCVIIELGYFRPNGENRLRPHAVKWFFAIFLLLPGLAALFYGITHPQFIVGGYEGRLFTPVERLLTEPRVLFDYMGALLLPRGPMLGVYTDDFMLSRGLLDPPSTLIALLALASLVIATLFARTRLPAFFVGMGLYFAGHVMESTIFPLELYFEHRNYLPSAGFFLALVSVAAWAFSRLPATDAANRSRRLLSFGCIIFFIALSVSTLARTSVWRTFAQIAEQGARQHPQSLRAQLDFVNVLHGEGRYAEMQSVFDHMLTMDNPAARHAGIINSVGLSCLLNGSSDEVLTARMATISGAKIELPEMQAFESLGKALLNRACEGLSSERLADIIDGIADSSLQSATLIPVWRSRFIAAELYAASGKLQKAIEQATQAWQTGAADTAIGVYLAQLHLNNNNHEQASRILSEVRQHLAPWDTRNKALADKLQEALDGTTSPTL